MNWDRVEGNWKEFKGKVQQKWGKLTDDDLDVIEGSAPSLPAGFSSATALPRTTPTAKSTLGSKRELIGADVADSIPPHDFRRPAPPLR